MRSLAILTFGLVLAACGRSEMESSTAQLLNPEPEIIEFHIVNGTGKNPWNTKETAVEMTVGQVLRIYNDDTVNHQLHTNGSPFGHGNLITPNTFLDHVTKTQFEPINQNQEIYDHIVGPSATFYLRVKAPAQ